MIWRRNMTKAKHWIAGVRWSTRLTGDTHEFHTQQTHIVKLEDLPSDVAVGKEPELIGAHSLEAWRINSRIAQAGVAF